jgi:hypothetical protein
MGTGKFIFLDRIRPSTVGGFFQIAESVRLEEVEGG